MSEETRKKNQIIGGRYLIEHRPGREEPWEVWPVGDIFDSERQSFRCATEAEAMELVNALLNNRG